jgi:hypothetical protein
MRALPPHLLSRRRFLAVTGGAATGAVLLGACGDDDENVDSEGSATSAVRGAEGLALAQFFGGPMFVRGQPLRAPFGVADVDGLVPVDRTPDRLSVTVLDADGEEVGVVDVDRRAEGLPRAYFPLAFTPERSGIYTARTEIDGVPTEMSLMVDEAADVEVVQPGAAMPALETPTTADARGVDPICTADPVCPLHDATVAEVLATGAPMALLVATPAFCQITICGPVLDVLLEVTDAHPDVRFLHAEVYADPANDPKLERSAPVVEDLGLHFEPCLVLVGSDGRVAERLDTIYDRSELSERLAQLS